MKKQQTEFEQLVECKDKIESILNEYNCDITFDDELRGIIIHDRDSNQFLSPYDQPWQ